METAMSRRKALALRQLTVQRRNLVNVCRLAVKSLIDKSSMDIIDNDSEELTNFLAILEQILTHRVRSQKTWFGSEEPKSFWDYIRAACKRVPHNCIESINSIENIRSAIAKGQAWLRVALMEKRLSEYLTEALKQNKVTKNFYYEGAIMLSEDANMLRDILIGLNAIDFNFCLKGESLELVGPIVIDYSPYLQFFQSSESMTSDLLEISNSSSTSSLMAEENLNDNHWRAKYQKLEATYRVIHEQKGYFEELVRLREDQLSDFQKQHRKLVEALHCIEAEARSERQQLESVVIELQGQLSAMKDYNQTLQQELLFLMSRQQMIPMVATTDLSFDNQQDNSDKSQLQGSDQHSYSSSDVSHVVTPSISSSNMNRQAGLAVPMYKMPKKEDSQSLVPLAGSFSSEASVGAPPKQGSDEFAAKAMMEGSKFSSSTEAVTQRREEGECVRAAKIPKLQMDTLSECHVEDLAGSSSPIDNGNNTENVKEDFNMPADLPASAVSQDASNLQYSLHPTTMVQSFDDMADNTALSDALIQPVAIDNGNQPEQEVVPDFVGNQTDVLNSNSRLPLQSHNAGGEGTKKDSTDALSSNANSDSGSSSWSEVGLTQDSSNSNQSSTTGELVNQSDVQDEKLEEIKVN